MIESLPPIADDECYLFLVRHAATANNVAIPPRLQGRHADVGLSSEGRAEAAAAARFLATFRFAAIYSSPLLRARETAQQIAQSSTLAVEVVDPLIECDLGNWEGKTWSEVQRVDHDAWQRFRADPSIHGYGSGENLSQVLARVEPAFARLVQSNLGQAIAIVSHKVVNRVYLARHLPCPLRLARDLPQANAAINLVRFRAGQTQVLTLNSLWHLAAWSEG